jgi:nitroreductase
VHDRHVSEPLLHPLLANRSSPTTFDATSSISDDEIESILEAARWAPSAGNSQPWAFIVARRGEPDHVRLTSRLARSAAAWAPSADLLVANLAHRFVEGTDWDYSEFSLYDLGQAVAHMTVQAQALGLRVRQFRAFDRAGIVADFGVPPHWEVCTMSAIGHVAGSPSTAPPMRSRRPTPQLRWPEAGARPDR